MKMPLNSEILQDVTIELEGFHLNFVNLKFLSPNSVFDFEKLCFRKVSTHTLFIWVERKRKRKRTYSSDNKGTRRSPARQRGERSRRRRRTWAKLGDGGDKRAPEMRPGNRSNEGRRWRGGGSRRENCSRRRGAGSHGHSLSISLSLSLSLCDSERIDRIWVVSESSRLI